MINLNDLPPPVLPEVARDAALAKVYSSISLIELFVVFREDFKQFIEHLPPQHQKQGQALYSRIESLVSVLDSETTTLAIVQTNRESTPSSIIEKLGLGPSIVKAHERRESINSIAKMYNISGQSVRRFINIYQSLAPSQRAAYQRRSIFDLRDRIEELGHRLSINAARLEGSVDAVAVQYLREYRQLLEFADVIASKFTKIKHIQEFMLEVSSLLQGELPQKQHKIITMTEDLKKKYQAFN